MIFHSRITAQISGQDTVFDRYGNPVPAPVEEVDFFGELIGKDGSEPREPNRNVVETSFRLLIPPHIHLGAHDKVVINGDTYKLIGNPMPLLVGGRLHHFEANVERTTG